MKRVSKIFHPGSSSSRQPKGEILVLDSTLEPPDSPAPAREEAPRLNLLSRGDSSDLTSTMNDASASSSSNLPLHAVTMIPEEKVSTGASNRKPSSRTSGLKKMVSKINLLSPRGHYSSNKKEKVSSKSATALHQLHTLNQKRRQSISCDGRDTELAASVSSNIQEIMDTTSSADNSRVSALHMGSSSHNNNNLNGSSLHNSMPVLAAPSDLGDSVSPTNSMLLEEDHLSKINARLSGPSPVPPSAAATTEAALSSAKRPISPRTLTVGILQDNPHPAAPPKKLAPPAKDTRHKEKSETEKPKRTKKSSRRRQSMPATTTTTSHNIEGESDSIAPLSVLDLSNAPTKLVIESATHGTIETTMSKEDLMDPLVTKVIRRLPNGNLFISPKEGQEQQQEGEVKPKSSNRRKSTATPPPSLLDSSTTRRRSTRRHSNDDKTGGEESEQHKASKSSTTRRPSSAQPSRRRRSGERNNRTMDGSSRRRTSTREGDIAKSPKKKTRRKTVASSLVEEGEELRTNKKSSTARRRRSNESNAKEEEQTGFPSNMMVVTMDSSEPTTTTSKRKATTRGRRKSTGEDLVEENQKMVSAPPLRKSNTTKPSSSSTRRKSKEGRRTSTETSPKRKSGTRKMRKSKSKEGGLRRAATVEISAAEKSPVPPSKRMSSVAAAASRAAARRTSFSGDGTDFNVAQDPGVVSPNTLMQRLKIEKQNSQTSLGYRSLPAPTGILGPEDCSNSSSSNNNKPRRRSSLASAASKGNSGNSSNTNSSTNKEQQFFWKAPEAPLRKQNSQADLFQQYFVVAPKKDPATESLKQRLPKQKRKDQKRNPFSSGVSATSEMSSSTKQDDPSMVSAPPMQSSSHREESSKHTKKRRSQSMSHTSSSNLANHHESVDWSAVTPQDSGGAKKEEEEEISPVSVVSPHDTGVFGVEFPQQQQQQEGLGYNEHHNPQKNQGSMGSIQMEALNSVAAKRPSHRTQRRMTLTCDGRDDLQSEQKPTDAAKQQSNRPRRGHKKSLSDHEIESFQDAPIIGALPQMSDHHCGVDHLQETTEHIPYTAGMLPSPASSFAMSDHEPPSIASASFANSERRASNDESQRSMLLPSPASSFALSDRVVPDTAAIFTMAGDYLTTEDPPSIPSLSSFPATTTDEPSVMPSLASISPPKPKAGQVSGMQQTLGAGTPGGQRIARGNTPVSFPLPYLSNNDTSDYETTTEASFATSDQHTVQTATGDQSLLPSLASFDTSDARNSTDDRILSMLSPSGGLTSFEMSDEIDSMGDDDLFATTTKPSQSTKKGTNNVKELIDAFDSAAKSKLSKNRSGRRTPHAEVEVTMEVGKSREHEDESESSGNIGSLLKNETAQHLKTSNAPKRRETSDMLSKTLKLGPMLQTQNAAKAARRRSMGDDTIENEKQVALHFSTNDLSPMRPSRRISVGSQFGMPLGNPFDDDDESLDLLKPTLNGHFAAASNKMHSSEQGLTETCDSVVMARAVKQRKAAGRGLSGSFIFMHRSDSAAQAQDKPSVDESPRQPPRRSFSFDSHFSGRGPQMLGASNTSLGLPFDDDTEEEEEIVEKRSAVDKDKEKGMGASLGRPAVTVQLGRSLQRRHSALTSGTGNKQVNREEVSSGGKPPRRHSFTGHSRQSSDELASAEASEEDEVVVTRAPPMRASPELVVVRSSQRTPRTRNPGSRQGSRRNMHVGGNPGSRQSSRRNVHGGANPGSRQGSRPSSRQGSRRTMNGGSNPGSRQSSVRHMTASPAGMGKLHVSMPITLPDGASPWPHTVLNEAPALESIETTLTEAKVAEHNRWAANPETTESKHKNEDKVGDDHNRWSSSF